MKLKVYQKNLEEHLYEWIYNQWNERDAKNATRKNTKIKHVLICPDDIQSEKGEYYIDNESHYEYYNRKTKVQNIEMDIAISVTEKEGNKSGIGIAKIINVGTSSENAIQNESVSKIKFSIPLVLPTSNTREYYQKICERLKVKPEH